MTEPAAPTGEHPKVEPPTGALAIITKALGVPALAILAASGAVIVHGWRIEAKAEEKAVGVVEQRVSPLEDAVKARGEELAVLRARVETVDSGVRAEVRDVKAEVSQLRVSLDRMRDEQKARDELLLREVRKR